MPVREFECHGCNSTFIIRDEERVIADSSVTCPRCKSVEVTRYYFPRDACRLYNLVKPDPESDI